MDELPMESVLEPQSDKVGLSALRAEQLYTTFLFYLVATAAASLNFGVEVCISQTN